ncbi:fumarylacetoacetate hydrolase family protein [Streptomyces griseoruber]|uniref:Fumarylacetoacetase n=2 Tax=Streptomyces griseoruber TaxID=1943 RepID=A0A101SJZ5_9ACTN|nr:fumarylacetoacetate hydrolase family protein [Streptomyces griseoruber]KUN75213.1 fumarylacetoacetase [Streptomyces griseoruber]
MSMSVLRTADAWWVLTPTGASHVHTDATTTGQLLADRQAVAAAAASGGSVAVTDLSPISPVTAPCRLIAQMINSVSHVKDTGGNPESAPLAFFRKSSSSISGPFDDVIRPSHVRLLDYEVEIGLVVGKHLPVGTRISEGTLSDYLAGLVVTNDVSARDVQLPSSQYYEGKSYPTFTPVGPLLVLLDADELKRFGDLRLKLWVNGELRQNMPVAGDMIYQPLEALQSLARFQRLDAGDLILTGTPVGTAISAPPKAVQTLVSLIPEETKWKLFFQGQSRNPKYLKDGDVIEATVATDGGAIDLGRQRTVVRDAG